MDDQTAQSLKPNEENLSKQEEVKDSVEQSDLGEEKQGEEIKRIEGDKEVGVVNSGLGNAQEKDIVENHSGADQGEALSFVPLQPPPPPPPPPPPSGGNFVFNPDKGALDGNLKKPFLIGGGILVLVLAITGLGVYLVKSQNLNLIQRATQNWSGKLVCMPVDSSGNLTNDKYSYNRIKVINNTSRPVPVWIQENECAYEGERPTPGYVCNNYRSRRNDTIGVGEEKIYSIEVGCQKIGQLDVKRDNDESPQCFNTVDNREWEGGIAFTIFVNPSLCPTPTPQPTATPTLPPSTPTPGVTTTPSPTPTPTEVPLEIECMNLKINEVSENELNKLKVGMKISFTVYFGGEVEDVAVVIKRDGVRVATLRAGEAKTREWISPSWTIDRAGNYEVVGLVKVNGEWR